MTLILRCRDFHDTSLTVAALYGVPPEALAVALPAAVQRALEDQDDPIGMLPSTLAAGLERDPVEPLRIHYFHGTRANDPTQFLRDGLLPLGQVLESIWEQLGGLVPELSETELGRLRSDLTSRRIDPPTYGLRVASELHHGPCGHLLRDALMFPGDYGAVDYLAGSEIVIDICKAIEEATGLDATARYTRATTPCVVEFSVAASEFDGALSAALWYLDAGLRDERTPSGNWSYCGDGQSVAAGEIVAVDITDHL